MAAAEISPPVLLGRTEVDVGEARFASYLAGARVLVTGAGGSLGRVLCRRLANLDVDELVLVDQAEAALAEAHDELCAESRSTHVVPVLADLRSPPRVRSVVARHLPSVVFHAAAYKVVPIVEASPLEAIATNVLTTGTMAEAASAAGVERFVLFTTDKAVRPTSLLGETKAAAECVVGTVARSQRRTRFACIRLGNVIDSSGSMLPLFRRRLAARRPVPITDARVTRYLMTGDEAAGLAIVAGALANRGEAFRLDMGGPIRVLDAARSLLGAAANGDTPRVEFVGLRPGEKLHEELDLPNQPPVRTEHERIYRSAARHAEPSWLEERLARLRALVDEADADEARAELALLVAGIHVGDPLADGVRPA